MDLFERAPLQFAFQLSSEILWAVKLFKSEFQNPKAEWFELFHEALLSRQVILSKVCPGYIIQGISKGISKGTSKVYYPLIDYTHTYRSWTINPPTPVNFHHTASCSRLCVCVITWTHTMLSGMVQCQSFGRVCQTVSDCVRLLTLFKLDKQAGRKEGGTRFVANWKAAHWKKREKTFQYLKFRCWWSTGRLSQLVSLFQRYYFKGCRWASIFTGCNGSCNLERDLKSQIFSGGRT